MVSTRNPGKSMPENPRPAIFFLVPVLFFCLGLVFSSPRPLPAAETGDLSWKVGILLPLSGPRTAVGQSERQAFILGQEQINRQGGIKGRRLDLRFIDTAGEPRQTATSLEKILGEDEDLLLLAGGIDSAAAWSAARLAEKWQKPLLINTASSPELTRQEWQYVFRLNQVDEEYLEAPISRYLRQLPEPLPAAILYADEICPTETARRLRRVCARLRLDLAVWNRFTPGKNDYPRLLTQIQEQKPGILFLVGSQTDAAVILRLCRQLPQPPAEVFFCNPDFSREGAAPPYRELFTGVKTTSLWGTFLAGEKITAFQHAYAAAVQEAPDYHAAQAYACLEVIADLLRRRHPTAIEDVRQLLAATEVETVYGPVRFVSDELFTNQNRLTGHLIVWQNDHFELVRQPQKNPPQADRTAADR